MALEANALVPYETVRDELGLSGTTDQAKIERYINVASERIAQYCNRVFRWSSGITENVAGFGAIHLRLSRTPLLTITSVKIDGTLLAVGEYAIDDAAAGLLVRKTGVDGVARAWPWTTHRRPDIAQDPFPGAEEKLIEVVYTGGYVTDVQKGSGGAPSVRTLPFDLEQACVDLAVIAYRRKGEAQDVVSESVQGASITYDRGYDRGAEDRSGIPAGIRAVLDKYARAAQA